jgi:hypothetical protein
VANQIAAYLVLSRLTSKASLSEEVLSKLVIAIVQNPPASPTNESEGNLAMLTTVGVLCEAQDELAQLSSKCLKFLARIP